jgi:hypothetical protein
VFANWAGHVGTWLIGDVCRSRYWANLLINSAGAASGPFGVRDVSGFTANSWSHLGIAAGIGPLAEGLPAFFNGLERCREQAAVRSSSSVS